MLMLNVDLEKTIVMDGVSIKVIQPQWNGIAKQQNKVMLRLNFFLDGCMKMEKVSMKIFQQQCIVIAKQRSKAMNVRTDILAF